MMCATSARILARGTENCYGTVRRNAGAREARKNIWSNRCAAIQSIISFAAFQLQTHAVVTDQYDPGAGTANVLSARCSLTLEFKNQKA
jgi:hypothetical protein